MAAIPALALAAYDASVDMKPLNFKRRALGEYDVHIEMKYCGVCHTDLHFAKNDLGNTEYPLVPGHELAGVCVAVGSKVTKFAVGDHVGVGCFVDSCLECKQCKSGDEQYCSKGMTGTYGGQPKHGRAECGEGQATTYGGYSTQMVVHEHFAIQIPKTYPLEKAGPLLCAAITMYDPLKHWGAKEGTRVGIAGLGGLGQMGVMLAKALGCHVTVLSRGDAKKEFAKKIGADRYIASTDKDEIAAAAKSLDLILNTISANHDIAEFLSLLDVSGVCVQLGLAPKPHAVSQLPLMFGRTSLAGSLIGGIKNTQEVVNLCAEKGIFPEVEVHPVTDINRIYEALDSGNDTGVRYVLDLSTLTEATFEACKSIAPPKFGH